jgi:CDP-diacylglycerol--glycerol-3-phosphate 3-phosphatidyltransferase
MLLLSDELWTKYWACGLGLVAILTDKLDGTFARKFHEESEFGKIIDPLADKILVAVVAVVLTIQSIIPFWFVAVVIVRDILILSGGIYLKANQKVVLPSNIIGKIAVGVISVYLILSILNIEQLIVVSAVFLWISIFFLAISFFVYLNRFIKVILGKD